MLGSSLTAAEFLKRAATEMARVNPTEVQALGDAVHDAYRRRAMIFVIGNGGSGSNAGKCTIRPEDYDNDAKPRLRILSLTDNTPYILAWANDAGFERIFVEQLKNLASPGDLLIAISGSGNSPNILRAVEWANQHDLRTFGLTGYTGGKLRSLAHKNLHVALDDMGVVETIHLGVFHWVVGDMARRMNG
jgi:D-sedoheptulose 7-phosphate isomerase